VRVLLMGVQTVAVPASLTADITYHWWLSMIQPSVRGKIALDLEFLAAVLTRIAEVMSVLADEVRPQSLFASAYQAADDADKLVAGEFTVVRGFLVLLGEMRDHRGSLITAEIASYARESFLISWHYISESGILFLYFRFASTHDLCLMCEHVLF
jgi:hypothetical protein